MNITDNEIIKALNEKIELISKCYQEYLDNGGLKDLTAEKDIETLFQIKDFINRLQAENERLCERIKGQKKALFEQQSYTAELQADNERLKTMHSEMCIGMKVLKRNARKEFAERLKVSTYDKSIDDLLEEMEREENEKM